MMLKNSYFTFQEILNIYPLRAPVAPHDKNTSSTWFTSMIDDAGLKASIYGLSNTFDSTTLNNLINTVITIVYYRHDSDFFYNVVSDIDENPVLTSSDFIKAIKPLINVLDLTLPKYVPIFKQNEIYSDNPTAPIGSSSSSTTKFNDTPQNIGDYGDEDHTTNISYSSSESQVDTGSIMQRLEEMFRNFKSIILEWSNEFNKLFLKEVQL